MIKVRYATRCAVLQSCRGFDFVVVVVVVMLIPWVFDKSPLRYTLRCLTNRVLVFDVVVVVMLIPWVLDKGTLRYMLRCLTIVSWF